MFTLGDLAAAGLVPVAADGQPPAWLTYISTEDIEGTAGAVAAGGGRVLRPPTEVGARGRTALFADPEGAAFGVWQRGTFAGAQVASEPNAVCWNEVASRDLAGASAFYGKAFGWSDRPGELASGFDYREWVVQSRVVAGMVPMTDHYPPEVPAHWRIILEVDHCATVAARCAELGGQVVLGPLDVGVGHYAQLIDPHGAPFGVIELIPELRLTPPS